jgi:hypothetical protein
MIFEISRGDRWAGSVGAATASITSSERKTATGRGAGGRDRRVDDRFELNRAPGSLIHKGEKIPCEMLDISLSGCRLRTLRPFTAGALESVQVVLAIQEMVLTIWGATQWTTWDRTVGIRFIHPNGRTRNQLAGLLTCLVDTSAAEVVKQAVAESARQVGSPIIVLEHPLPIESELAVEEVVVEEEEFQAPPPPPAKPRRPELQSEYKVLTLDEGESPAVLHLVAEGTALAGNVLDVSQDGCLVQLEHSIAVRLKAQVEADFHLRGLQFRLPGVTTVTYGESLVEVRFTEMSRRKRDDLSQLIMELDAQNQAAQAQSETQPEAQSG